MTDHGPVEEDEGIRAAAPPTVELSSLSPTPVADLPVGEISRCTIDGSPCDLSESRVEKWGSASGDVTVTLILPAGESPEPGVPMRTTLVLTGSDGADVTGRWAADDGEPGLHVDSLRWDGERFRLGAWDLEPRPHDHDFDQVWWGLTVERPRQVLVRIERLSLVRPPYLALAAEAFTDGVWDLATVSAIFRDPVDVDDLDLPADLRGRIRRWNAAAERVDGWAAQRRHDDEGDEVAAALRAAWPASTVRFRRTT